VIIIAGITQARSVVVLVLVSIFLAILGAPPVLWLEPNRIPSLAGRGVARDGGHDDHSVYCRRTRWRVAQQLFQ
jgi:hypothetical protein